MLKNVEEEIVKEILEGCDGYITERIYQKIKNQLDKKDDYFSKNELKNLMQFLMQRQRKSIKNEGKRNKV